MDMPLDKEHASDARDALVKALYSRLFHWLLQRINATMMKHATSPRSHILLVDIFGFESFDRNGFEQLCINFANEKLQQLFHTVVFDDALDRYRREGLDVPKFELPYKQLEVLEVLDSKPKGIFTLLDDEVSIPKSSEYSLHSKLVTAHGKASTVFKAGKSTLTFTLVHYALPVTYDCADLLAKNKDHVADDILEFCHQECMSLLGEMAPPSPPTTRGDATISATFRRQLKELLARLKDTSIHFIRCIKPNHDQVRDVFDGPYVLDQLRQMGILQALALHHDGLHPFQESHELFYHSYRVIAPPTESTTGDTPQVIPMAERCRDLIQHFPHPGGFAVGITSVFSSLEMHQWLRRQRIAVEGAAVTILQGVWRRAVWRLACRHVGQSMALLHDVASLDDATLSQHVQHATDLVKRFPTCYLSRRLLLQCHEGQMHLERHRRQHDLLLRIQQPRHDLEAMEADLALCAKWRLEADPHVIAFTAAYHRLQTERQAVVQVTLMLRSKVIHVATVEKALRSPMISAQVAERARAALQETATESTDVLALADAIANSAVTVSTLQSNFVTWTSTPVDDLVTALQTKRMWSTSLHATLQLCHNLGKLRATLRIMAQHTAMEGLATLKTCIAVAVPTDADTSITSTWHNEVALARHIVDEYDRMHKLLAKAWLCKVPQEGVFFDLCDQMAEVSLKFGISFDPTLVREAQSMLEAIRQEKLFVSEVESLIAVCPDFAAKSHIHIDRLTHLGNVFELAPLYDKTEIAANVCLLLSQLRRAAKDLFECTSLGTVDAAWSKVQGILSAGHRQFDLLASDKWFRTMSHALEMEQQAATDLVDFKRMSVRVAKQLQLALASKSYEALVKGLGQVDRHHLHRDYTLRDLVLRAKDAVQASKNIRHELRHAIDLKSPDVLEHALSKAMSMQVHSRLVKRAARLLKSLKQLELEFALCQFDIDTARLAEIARRGAKLHLPSPALTRVEGLLQMSRDKFLQEQLKWAIHQNAPAADVLGITLALKHEFFQHCGDIFDMQHFPRLRDPTKCLLLPATISSAERPALTTSLTDLDAAETKCAVQISRWIHGYVGAQDQNDLYPLRYAHSLVHTGLSSRRLADEIYVQLVQQQGLSAAHVDASWRATKVWGLLQLCVSTFSPSDSCWNYLEYFLRRHDKLPLVTQLHAPKPPALTSPSLATLYRLLAPTSLRSDGWAKVTRVRHPRRRRKWLVLEGTTLYMFKDDSVKRDAIAAMDVLDIDIQTHAEHGTYSIVLPWRCGSDTWTLYLESLDEHSRWHHALHGAKVAYWHSVMSGR
ncbi:hypothetical protein, variant [Aphanomyces astaci]|nr:hypothetical protein, variant [Aphanomyces astaci]ETV84184.1 hypothetical protein, variant [Aphanomyces astaci]|eukprot:XP_009825876.1 hypothetical protein, variant [Aphanomyces astaci]